MRSQTPSIYQLEAENIAEAKKKLTRMTGISEDYFTLEDASLFDTRRPLWRRFFGV